MFKETDVVYNALDVTKAEYTQLAGSRAVVRAKEVFVKAHQGTISGARVMQVRSGFRETIRIGVQRMRLESRHQFRMVAQRLVLGKRRRERECRAALSTTGSANRAAAIYYSSDSASSVALLAPRTFYSSSSWESSDALLAPRKPAREATPVPEAIPMPSLSDTSDSEPLLLHLGETARVPNALWVRDPRLSTSPRVSASRKRKAAPADDYSAYNPGLPTKTLSVTSTASVARPSKRPRLAPLAPPAPLARPWPAAWTPLQYLLHSLA